MQADDAVSRTGAKRSWKLPRSSSVSSISDGSSSSSATIFAKFSEQTTARLTSSTHRPGKYGPRCAIRSSRFRWLDCCVTDTFAEQVEGLRREIRLSKGQGVAGGVAKSGKLVHIKDGEEAKQVLGETSDKLTGGVVKSMLCCAVFGHKGNIIAVLQAFHSQPRAFADVHEDLIERYSKLVFQSNAFSDRRFKATDFAIPWAGCCGTGKPGAAGGAQPRRPPGTPSRVGARQNPQMPQQEH